MSTIWPVLREDCVKEVSNERDAAANDALLWMVSKRMKAAIMVRDTEGHVLQANNPGREMLESGSILREPADGLQCGTHKETRALKKAISLCIEEGNTKSTEYVFFLEGAEPGTRLPISLSFYQNATHPTPLVLAMVPIAPDSKRIEMLAGKMGLTPAEARVASLIQMGLSNREAAEISGLKEQTLNTYAKRALNKLNVSCRTEMARLLTWQAAGGR